MSHLDEGTLHALLDGELEMTEVKEIQAHLGSCSACGTRLRQVKEFYTEADRLVGSLELPGAGAATAAAGGASRGRSATLAPRTEAARAPAPLPPTPEGPPPIFLPDNPDWSERTRRFIAPMKWAALLVLAVGAGFLVSETRRGRAPTAAAVDASDTSAPVVSAEEATPQPDSGALAGSADRLAARTPAESKAAPAAALPLAKAKDTSEGLIDSATAANDETVELADRSNRPATHRETARATKPAPTNVRNEAAKALEDLDRERRTQRAAAATAALDSARRRDESAQRQSPSKEAVVVTATNPATAPAPAAPSQRTLEQRADTYMRIGLDEAARQLGRPVHVIEGLSPLFMGLAQGRTTPGADTTRPVVRVVYQDAQGRLILLDQQRLRPGQDTTAPSGGQPHWTMGEILVHLQGEVGPEVLRTMRARVR
ncbi:MAG TPA: zf-HC2 domain-containing protein [Gemmatimonadales bacterium]|nr:zf-HC2 domain-containing protein [Gemmatimonadales bacterium]